jgi:hypothetical protein
MSERFGVKSIIFGSKFLEKLFLIVDSSEKVSSISQKCSFLAD